MQLHVFSSSYFTSSSVKVTSAPQPKWGPSLYIQYSWMLLKAPRKQVMMPKWVSFLLILTVLETLTPQGFFIRAFVLSVRKEQEVLLLRAVSNQCGWDGFGFLKN